ncbi:YfcC family protein [Algoriphagus namhaensis]
MKAKFPHPIIILLGFISFAALSTLFIQSGEYDRVLDEVTGRNIVVPGSFHPVADQNATVYDVFLSIPEGFIEGSEIIVLILLMGSSFYVIEKTGALQAGIESLIYTFRKSKALLLSILGIFFGFCGASIAMQEEVIALVPLLMLISKKLHYDVRALIALSLGCAMIGSSFSPINLFGSLLAINIAELPPSEGFVLRASVMVFALTVWIAYHIRFGKNKSETEVPKEFQKVKLSLQNQLVLAIMLVGILVLGWGVMEGGWGFNEMSSFFFAVGLVAGLAGKLGLNGVASAYVEGFKEMIFAGVIVGLARSVYLILQDSQIIDPLIQALFEPLEYLPPQLAALGMMLSNSIIHIPVPSTSGQAILTIPLAAPLADLLGLSRQVAIFAYQYGAGLLDLISPTNGAIMAVIAGSGIKYNDWIRYAIKPFALIYGIGLAITILSIYLF